MKKVLYVVLGIVLIWLVILVIDFVLLKNNHGPMIHFKTVEYDINDGHFIEYYSLGYKVIEEQKGWIKEFSIKPLWVQTAPDVKFLVLDETENVCLSGKSYIYEDTYFKYYFNCNRKIFLQFGKEKLSLTDALNQGRVTIEELKEEGLPILTESKTEFTFEIKPSNNCSFLEGDPTKLVKQKDDLYYYCLDKVNIQINKNYSSFKDAFNETIKADSIAITMNKEVTYESGAVLYSTNGYRMLVCSNGTVILGPNGMEYFDIFHEFCE